MLSRTERRDRPSATLLKVAGYGALGAIATLVVAGVALGIFFSDTEGLAVFGPINDIATGLTLVLMVPAVVALARLARAQGWFTALSAVTVAGMLLAAAGLLLLVLRLIDLQASFVVGGVGMLPFLAWLVAVAFLALRGQLLSRTVGRLAAALIGVIALSIVATPLMSMAMLAFTLAPLVLAILAGFLYVLGRDLLRASHAS